MSAIIRRRAAIGTAGCLLLAGVFGILWLMQQPPLPLLQRIQQQGVLVVGSRYSPTVYFQGADGPDGFEYALAQLFAEYLDVELRFVFPPNLDALFDATARGTVHMAAAGLTITPAREQQVRFSAPYEQITEQIVYRRGSRRPRSLTEIAPGDLHVVASSSHEETLHALRENELPTLSWQSHARVSSDELFAAIDREQIRLTIADSNELELSRRLFRHAAVAFELGEPRPIAWAFPKTVDDSLRQAANDFLLQAQEDGTLQRLKARFFGHTGRLNFVDTREFWRGVRDRLPALRPYFERAAEQTGIDWRLLAAIGYQESHWQVDAVSPTGVRGVMMLTQATAEQMGITDRRDPEQSIIGGAKYLRTIEKRIPARIREPNRLWLTLAGYNVGFGHLEDARILTERDGANPDLWLEVKQRLPLLAQKKHYKTLRHGFARGQEPVDYVDHIRNYYDLLVWFTTTRDRETRALLLAAETD